MSNENNSDEISVKIISEDESNTNNDTIEDNDDKVFLEELKNLLEKEKEKSQDLENKLKHALADFQNLDKKSQFEIENGINMKLSQFMIEFLKIYDDFIRAKEVFSSNKVTE